MFRKTLLLTFVIGTISISTLAQGNAKKNGADSQKGIEIMGVIAKWADAVRDRDMKVLDHLFAEDLIITTYEGTVRGKKEELEALTAFRDATLRSVVNEDVGIKLYTNIAVVTALTKMTFVMVGKENVVALRYTSVFAKLDGRWQMVALQTARAALIQATKSN